MGILITFYTDLPKDSNPGIGAGTAYQIGKQLNSEFNARGCDQAQIICSFIAGLSKDARQRLGNVISGAENTEATGTTSTGKRKRDPDDMPKSPAGMLLEFLCGFCANLHSSGTFEAAQPQDGSPTRQRRPE